MRTTTIALTLMMVGPLAIEQDHSFKEPIAAAEVVVAVEILSTDYSRTPADGPMLAAARPVKVLKGPLTVGRPFRFSESAWVGPTYKKGEYRVLLLERATEAEAPAPWRTLVALRSREDFFIEKRVIGKLSLDSLEALVTTRRSP